MVKTIGWVWFQPGGRMQNNIGIVITINQVEETKAYIGYCQEGNKEHEDVIYIAQWGAKFDLEAAQKIVSEKGKTQIINVPSN